MKQGPGLEPFQGKTLSAYIEAKGGEHLRTTGSHILFEMPSRLGSVKPDQWVTRSHAADIARRLGMSYRDFRADIGHPITASGSRPRHKAPPKAAKTDASKGQVLRTIAEVREMLNELDSSLRNGQRDPSVYAQAFGSLKKCRAALEDATPGGRAQWGSGVAS